MGLRVQGFRVEGFRGLGFRVKPDMNPKRPPYYDFLYISPGNLIDLEVRRCQACEGQIFNYGLASDLLSSKCAAPRFTGVTTPRQAWYMLEGSGMQIWARRVAR